MSEVSQALLESQYDLGLGGTGYLVAWEIPPQTYNLNAPITEEGDDLLVERRDQSPEMSENKLDRLFWESQRDWSGGAGQQRFSAPQSSDRAFYDSTGIDITTVGQATLLKGVSRVLTLTNQAPVAPQKMGFTDSYVYVAAGKPNVKRFGLFDGTDVATLDQSGADGADNEVYDMASDGATIYVAVGDGGTHKATDPATTAQHNFDSLSTWTSVDLTPAQDTADFQEGTASTKFTNTSANTGTSRKLSSDWSTAAATKDFSSVDQFKIRFKVNKSGVVVKLRLGTSDTVYWERTVTTSSTSPGTWYEDISSRTADWTAVGGIASWTAIDRFIIAVAPASNPTFWSKQQNSTFTPTSTVTVSNPSPNTVYTGTLLVWSIFINTGATVTTPSGWTVLHDTVIGDGRLWTAYRVPDGSESSTFSATLSTADLWATAALKYISVNTSSPIHVSGTDGTTSGNTTLAAPSVTTSIANTTLITIHAGVGPIGGGASFTAPSGMTERSDSGAGAGANPIPSLDLNDLALGAAGATGQKIATASVTVSDRNMHSIALTPISPVVYLDDFRSVITGAFSHFSDHDARVLEFAKDRLFGAGLKSGSTTQWEFFEVGSTTTSVVRAGASDGLPDNWAVSDIAELGPYVYFSAYRGSKGAVMAYGVNTDGTAQKAFRAVALPSGDIPISMVPFLGQGMLIGCRRVGSTSGGLGVVYRAFPAASGHLSIEEVTVLGTVGDGTDYAPGAVFEQGKHAFFGWNNSALIQGITADTSGSSGLGVYVPSTGGFSRHLGSTTESGPVEGAGVFKGRKVFSIGGQGVYVEQATYRASGAISGSIMDWNIDAPKVLLQEEVGYQPLPAGTEVEIAYTTDGGVTWTSLGTDSTDDSTVIQKAISTPDETISAGTVRYRVSLATTTNTNTPTLKKAGIGALYGQKPRYMHRIVLKAYDRMELKNGAPHPTAPVKLSYTIENALKTLRDNQTIVAYQDPNWVIHQDSVPVRVGGVHVLRNHEPQVGFKNLVVVDLVEVPA